MLRCILLLPALLLLSACAQPASDTAGEVAVMEEGAHGHGDHDTMHAGEAPAAEHGEMMHGGHADAETGQHPAPPPPIPDAPEVVVTATEFSFVVDGVDLAEQPLRLTAPVNIVLVNQGEIAHEFDVAELGFHLHAEAGERVTGGLRDAPAGTYSAVCAIAGHADAGMVGELTVEA